MFSSISVRMRRRLRLFRLIVFFVVLVGGQQGREVGAKERASTGRLEKRKLGGSTCGSRMLQRVEQRVVSNCWVAVNELCRYYGYACLCGA